MSRNSKYFAMVFGLILSVMILSGIAAGMGSSPGMPQIKISGQDARLSPVMIGVGSIFMKIENSGSGDDSLINARLAIPGTITEIHDIKDGKMVKIDRINVPSGSAVELKPKGLHVMVFKMPETIKDGSEVTLHLTFERTGDKLLTIKFGKWANDKMGHGH